MSKWSKKWYKNEEEKLAAEKTEKSNRTPGKQNRNTSFMNTKRELKEALQRREVRMQKHLELMSKQPKNEKKEAAA